MMVTFFSPYILCYEKIFNILKKTANLFFLSELLIFKSQKLKYSARDWNEGSEASPPHRIMKLKNIKKMSIISILIARGFFKALKL